MSAEVELMRLKTKYSKLLDKVRELEAEQVKPTVTPSMILQYEPESDRLYVVLDVAGKWRKCLVSILSTEVPPPKGCK